LGGGFLNLNPYAIEKVQISTIKKRIKSFWLWNHNSEKDLLEKIYFYLKKISDESQNANSSIVSSVLCGIGITSADIPILFDLFKRYHLLSNAEAFDFQHSFRVIDLSQIAITTFNKNISFLYPITKDRLLNSYLNGKKFESGKCVWKHYELKQYNEIEHRVKNEILATYECYIEISKEKKNQ
jgi:hypothetical protein